MNYWHIQVFDDSEGANEDQKSSTRIQELLQTKQVIGVGDGSNAKNDFEQKMKAGDIVVVRQGSKAIGLVKVIGEFEDIGANKTDIKGQEENIDWMRYRRAVKFLTLAPSDMNRFVDINGTLQISLSKGSDTYKYIHSWFRFYKGCIQ